MGVKLDTAESIIPLNRVRKHVTGTPAEMAEAALRDLHFAIQEALAHQIERLDIDYQSAMFDLKDPSGRFSGRCRRVVYEGDPSIAEEYYWDDTLLVRVRKSKYESETGQEQLAFTIEVPRYGDGSETGPAG